MKRQSRFRFDSIDYDRVKGAISRRLKDIPVSLSWQTSAFAKVNRDRIASLRNAHKGDTCVVICNGPSLRHTDMDRISSTFSFTMNRAYLSFDEWGFRGNVHVAINDLVVEQFAVDLSALEMPLFTSYSFREILKDAHAAHYLRVPHVLNDFFQTDLRKPVASGGTVTFVALQIAFFLGFKKTIIVGMDHKFSAVGVPNKTERHEEAEDNDHYRPDYFPKGTMWQLPDLYRSELGYALARRSFEMDGRRIFDATVDGACSVFEKCSLDLALKA